MKLLVVVWTMVATSCGSGPSITRVHLDDLGYEVPSHWQSRDLSDRYTKRIEWTPPDNATAKQSVVIVRTSPRVAAQKGNFAYLQATLEEAQRNLPGAKFSAARMITTKNHLIGVRVDGELVPPGQSEQYHRSHAVLVDGAVFVHVLFTSRDADREVFDIVLDSLVHEER